MDHTILKKKLDHYGFRGKFLEFIMSFIQNRNYFVYVNGLNSCTKNLNIGVPQGSTLGPLFFLIFINDMKNCSELLKFIQFADDTTIMFSCPDIQQLNEVLEREANKVLVWLKANRLILNVSKTVCMLFSNKCNASELKITLDGTELVPQTETTFLGVIIDHKLTWKPHIKHISSKVSKSIAILRILRFSFPKHILRMIYMSLVFSHINYCNLIWGSACKTTLDPLIKLQKKSIRLVNNSYYLEHTAPIFQSLKILKVQQVFKLNCLIFMYKCTKNNKFPNFKLRLLKNFNVHSYNTRIKEHYRIPNLRLRLCREAYFVNGLILWNLLEDSMKMCPNLINFKQNVKELIIHNIFD